jgi:predicted dehydrogenase
MKTYNVGLIGFGMIGKVHAYCYSALPFYYDWILPGSQSGVKENNLPLFYDPPPLRARITHVVTSRAESAEKARATVAADVAATDYRAVTENPQIDIVHICTPNHLHKEALLSAIRHQKHIYCDKPLVARMDEAQEVQAALAGYRGIAQMTFQNRFFPATMRAKQLIDAGALGTILGFRVCYLHGGSASPTAPLKWKMTAGAGGGVIADLGSHLLDLVDWLIGPFAAVMAATQIAYPQRPSAADPAAKLPVDVEDCVMLLARMQTGALGTIEATKIATGTEDEIRLEIHGSRGALRFNGMDPHHLEFHDASAPDSPLGGLRGWNRIDSGQRYSPPAASFPSPKAAMGWIRGHLACLENFLEAVAQGRAAQPGLEQGIRVQRLMECVRQSAAEKRWVEV